MGRSMTLSGTEEQEGILRLSTLHTCSALGMFGKQDLKEAGLAGASCILPSLPVEMRAQHPLLAQEPEGQTTGSGGLQQQQLWLERQCQ